jgi:putative DNA primase/helicase
MGAIMDDAFDFSPLTTEELAANPAIPHLDDDNGECIMPIPDDALDAPKTHFMHGAPSQVWTYRDAAGAVLFHVCRFETQDGKEIRPLSLWRASKGRLEWRWKGVPEPRPLYGLDRLAANPGAPVVICEGEKSCDAAAKIFPKSVCVTSPGGLQEASKADWIPLAGRKVLIWPDSDDAGAKYASKGAIILAGLDCDVSTIDAESLAAIDPGGGRRDPVEGWDAADAIEEWKEPCRTSHGRCRPR